MDALNLFSHLDLLSVGVATAANVLLGFVVYLNNRKSITNNFFFLFTFVSAVWGIYNYLLYQFNDPVVSLWFIRLVMLTAIWQAYSFYLLSYVYPSEAMELPKYLKGTIFFLVVFVSFLTLTPLVFSGISVPNAAGEVAAARPGPGILAFALLAIGLVVGGLYQLFKRRQKSKGIARKQYNLFLTGTALMFGLIIFFNFITPNLFHNYSFIPLGAVFVFPFIFFTAYDILKNHLFDSKVITTEIITFFLLVSSSVEIVISKSSLEIAFRVIVFIILLVVSVLLLRSVRKEVEQREQLEALTKELGEANVKLKTLDQARAEFITIASHQLRTPPATIKWYLSAILSGDYGKVPAKILAQLKKTESTNNHLISLIEDMLNVSRIERGKMEFLFEPTNAEELACFSFEQLLPIAGEKGLKLTYSPPPRPLPKIMADKEKLRQVMNNLIDNAIKYTKLGGVTMSLFLQGDEIKFQVQDTGKGISDEERDTIFQKYSRGKESVKQSAGLGLGLYVAKIIIGEHKGKIWAESSGVSQGSTFCFTLPINSGLKQTTLVDLA